MKRSINAAVCFCGHAVPTKHLESELTKWPYFVQKTFASPMVDFGIKVRARDLGCGPRITSTSGRSKVLLCVRGIPSSDWIVGTASAPCNPSGVRQFSKHLDSIPSQFPKFDASHSGLTTSELTK